MLQNGGAIYIDLIFSCDIHAFQIPMTSFYTVQFINNSAGIAGNAIFFSVPKACEINTNITNVNSIMFAPCKFKYFQPVNGTMLQIPCDYHYTILNGTGSPIVTTPHQLKLYFPYSIGFSTSYGTYFVKNNILGNQIMFTGAVFDYFEKPTEPTQFNVQCFNCSKHSLLHKYHLLIDNVTALAIAFKGDEIKSGSVNVTVNLKSLFYSLQEINVTLMVEILPCISHPGKSYSDKQHICVCYQHNVNCYDDYNEIKRGYWFGSISNKATTSPCPKHYCKFINRRETREGYFELPKTIDAQCNHNRTGRACGECCPEYTLAYDTTDCISVDHCNTGSTVLVALLTFLYWIIIVVVVFILLYFINRLSLGYMYGIIYYYSMARILFSSNPYIAESALFLISNRIHYCCKIFL